MDYTIENKIITQAIGKHSVVVKQDDEVPFECYVIKSDLRLNQFTGYASYRVGKLVLNDNGTRSSDDVGYRHRFVRMDNIHQLARVPFIKHFLESVDECGRACDRDEGIELGAKNTLEFR